MEDVRLFSITTFESFLDFTIPLLLMKVLLVNCGLEVRSLFYKYQ